MNGSSRINEQNSKAQLAAQFNEFYLQTTSSSITQIGNYKVIREIGEGAFGKVYLATHTLLNVNVVLKCGLIDDPNIVREIYYHRQLKHKNIVKLYEIIKTESHLWLALEYCEGNELFYYIYEQRRLDVETCKKLFVQILHGIKYVHSLHLSHRDLKLENILLADKQKTIVKLTDFGFVREFNPSKRHFLSTVCGTTVYMAPELLKNQKYSGFSVDIWSLGVILFTMLYGEMPFDEDDDLKTKYKIIHEDPVYKDSIPPDAIALLKKILNKDPYKRPTLIEIQNSPFLSETFNRPATERSRRSSLYNDNDSIISINQHYNTNKIPFQSKIEKHLLKKLEKLNINIEQLQQSVHNDETNSLTAFYDLCLTQEFKKKKKRYMKEKRLRYYEAKKTLKKSRKRVKSALSLTDQNPSGSQPLERIISTLSLSSNRNVSGNTISDQQNNDSSTNNNNNTNTSVPAPTNRSPQNTSVGHTPVRKQTSSSLLDEDQSKLKVERRRSASASYIQNNSFSLQNSPSRQNLPVANDDPLSIDASRHYDARSNRGFLTHENHSADHLNTFQRLVSFSSAEDDKRRPSNVTALSSVTSENSKKRTKNNKILNKLQFWKRNRRNTIQNSTSNDHFQVNQNENSSSSNHSTGAIVSNGHSPAKSSNAATDIQYASDSPHPRRSQESMEDDQDDLLEINIRPKSSSARSTEDLKLSSPSSIKPSSNYDDDNNGDKINPLNSTEDAPNDHITTDNDHINDRHAYKKHTTDDSSKKLNHTDDSPSSPIPIIETHEDGTTNTIIESSPHDTTLELKDDLNTNMEQDIMGNSTQAAGDMFIAENNLNGGNRAAHLEFLSNGSDSPNLQTPTQESFYIPSGSRNMRTRPSSVVSQASQMSQFSQLSTMISESELDILDETDTMDEEFDDDEAAYESSLNMSQHEFSQHRHSSTGMTPTSSVSMSITNNKPSNGSVRKRPSYNRQLSSDVSILSTSTTATGKPGKPHSKRAQLFQVSSNSSEDSSVMNVSHSQNTTNSEHNNGSNTHNGSAFSNNGFASTAPLAPLASKSHDTVPPPFPRSNSPEFIRLLKRQNSSNNGKPPAQGKQASLMQPNPRSKRSSSPGRSASGSPKAKGMNKHISQRGPPFPFTSVSNGGGKIEDNSYVPMIRRSHSPPLPSKFNKLKFNHRLMGPRMKESGFGATIEENEMPAIDSSEIDAASRSFNWSDRNNGNVNPGALDITSTPVDDKFPLFNNHRASGLNTNASMNFTHSSSTNRFKSGAVINEEEEDED